MLNTDRFQVVWQWPAFRFISLRFFYWHSSLNSIQSFQFKITEIKDNMSVVVSRAAVMKAEASKKGAELMQTIEVGVNAFPDQPPGLTLPISPDWVDITAAEAAGEK